MTIRTKSAVRVALGTLAALILATACSEPSFRVKGEIEGADNTPVVLEKADFHGRWMAVDSTRTSGSGSFSITQAAPAAPEIYRLNVDGRYVYLPVDSTETLTVTSSLADFGLRHKVEGTPGAELLTRFDREFLAFPQEAPADSVAAFKRRVFTNYMYQNPGSVVTYYILTKTRGDRQLFDPQADDDYKYFAAVATGYKQMRPDDPHTKLLENTTLQAMRERNSRKGLRRAVEAEEIKLVDIELRDEKGDVRKLSDVAGKGKPTVVVFSVMTAPDSPDFNRRLSEVYKKRGGGLEIYQVSLDADQYAWRDAAVNLPWVTVFDPEGASSQAAARYNVGALPAFFIYNANGELIDRAFDFDSLNISLYGI